jgi:dienelactone hydrolase
MTNLLKAAALVTALLVGNTIEGSAQSGPPAEVVRFESLPVSAAPLTLQAYLRRPDGAGPFSAVVLLHGCNGNWGRLDERWGETIASWGYVTLTIDSFGPRAIKNSCSTGPPAGLLFDGYRALDFLVREPFVDPKRVAIVGFSQGGSLTLWSVERGDIERTSEKNKFRAAAAFYPMCGSVKGIMTVPTLILIGERDDWTPADACRKMVEGHDDWGISRQKGAGAPIRLVVYPGAHHAFDVPALQTPIQYLGHHLEFNQPARDQSIDALREFLDATIGVKAHAK